MQFVISVSVSLLASLDPKDTLVEKHFNISALKLFMHQIARLAAPAIMARVVVVAHDASLLVFVLLDTANIRRLAARGQLFFLLLLDSIISSYSINRLSNNLPI